MALVVKLCSAHQEYLESPMGKYALTAPTGCPVDFNAGPEDTMCKNRPRSGIESAKMRFNSMDRFGSLCHIMLC